MKRIAGRVPVFTPEPPLGGSLRRGWKNFGEQDTYEDERNDVLPSDLADVNIYTSQIRNDPKERHMVALDIDVPVQVYPSTHEGHHHLYIEKPLSQFDYFRLVSLMAELGIVEKGFYEASLARGYTALRAPWVRKSAIPDKRWKKAMEAEERMEDLNASPPLVF